MNPKFIAAIYAEGHIYLFEEYGDVYEFNYIKCEWILLLKSPWPR